MNTTSTPARFAAAALCVAALVGVAAGCGSDDASASKKQDGTTTTTVADGSTTTTTGGAAEPDQPGYVTLPAVGVGEPSPLAPNLTATVTSVEAEKLKARGPGDVAGPGVVVTVEIRNDTTQAVNLDLTAVNANYGTDTPASPNRGATEALAGQLAPGQSKSGHYGFRVPDDATGLIRIDIQQSASPNIVIVQAAK
jgi:hypothetical protein